MVHARFEGVKAVNLIATCGVESSQQLSGVDRLHPAMEVENEMRLHDVFMWKQRDSRAEQYFLQLHLCNLHFQI